jgi:hypothetical protein
MPSFVIKANERQDIIAYILSLLRSRSIQARSSHHSG